MKSLLNNVDFHLAYLMNEFCECIGYKSDANKYLHTHTHTHENHLIDSEGKKNAVSILCEFDEAKSWKYFYFQIIDACRWWTQKLRLHVELLKKKDRRQ